MPSAIKRKNLRGASALAVLSALLCAALAAETSPAALTALEDRYRKATTLQATFLERYSDNGKQVRVEAGTAYFLRPGKMRWEYEKPEKSLFLVDGKYVWFYAPADRTATRMPTRKSEDWRTPIAFLTTGIKLSRLCSSVEETKDASSIQGDVVYRCVLRTSDDEPGAKPQAVLFEVTPQNDLARILVQQGAGMTIEFEFKNWQYNPVLPKTLFTFAPPPTTVIVNGLLPEAPGMRQ
jgi:outer membrane lipoprotein carrier protein